MKLISSSKMAFHEDERAIVAVWSSNMAFFEDEPGRGVGLAWENMCETPHFCTFIGEKRGNMCGMGVFTQLWAGGRFPVKPGMTILEIPGQARNEEGGPE